MKKKFDFANSGLLIVGFVLFILGLFMILRLNPLFNLLTQVTSDSQVIVAIGVIAQFTGQALVVFGAIRLTSQHLVSNMQMERKITLEGFNQNIRQLQNALLSEQQELKAGYLQAMAKIDALAANQKAAANPPSVPLPSNCKFCGEKMSQSRFCAQCGKAN